MAEITVRAIDSALAMEEVQKRLGDDALIISTQRIDGQIEITATDEEVIKPEKEIKPFILGDIYRQDNFCLLYTSPSPRDGLLSRMPSSA